MKKSNLWLIASFGILGAAYGCSSSSSTTPETSGDSGAQNPTNDGSVPDTGSTGNGTPDSGAQDSGGNGGDAAPACPGPVLSTDIPTYAPASPTLGNCTTGQVTDFIAACAATTSTNQTCNDWFSATANTNCGNCIAPADGQGNPISGGPTLVNPTTGDPLTNTPGCVALEDSTHGTACAAPFANYAQCEDVACGACSDQTSFNGCEETTSTGSGACATYYSSYSTSCATDIADGGVAANNGECQDLGFVITLFCGGADGGVADGGDGG